MQFSERLDPAFTPIFLIISTIVVVLVLYFIFSVIRQQRTSPGIQSLTIPLIFMLLSILSITISIFAGRLDYVFERDLQEVVYYTVGYTLYFVFWILGMGRFLRDTVRLPPENRAQFKRVQLLLYLIAFLLAIGTAVAMVQPGDSTLLGLRYNEFFQYAFFIISQFSILAFLYFAVVLNREKAKNASKLVKARLDILRYGVLLQVLLSFNVLIAALFLALTSIPDYIQEFFTLGSVQIIAAFSAYVIYSSIKIPHFVRARYNLTPRRFSRLRAS